MNQQSDKFIKKRDKIRKQVVMNKLGLKYQTYNKVMGQKVNGVYNLELSEWEKEDLRNGLNNLKDDIDDFIEEI